MIFESVQDLLNFFNNIDLEKSNIVLREEKKQEKEKDHVCSCQHEDKEEKEGVKENARVEFSNTALVESFSVPIELPVELHEGENTIKVTDYEFLHENFCSSGKLVIENRTVLMQMCDVNGIKKVNLSLSMGDSTIKEQEFIVVKSDTPAILLNKEHIQQ